MATYNRISGIADATLFDGTQAVAEALVAAYPDVISIQSDITYPELVGGVTVDPAETGVVATVDIVKADAFHPYIITVEVTEGADATGVVTIKFFKKDPIVVAVTLGDDALTVAAAIAGGTFPGFTAVDNLDGTITITQDSTAQTSAVLAIINHKGETLNAYVNQYVAFIESMNVAGIEVDTTEVWNKADFEKYFVSSGS
jgi:hypothetical protein